MARRDGLFIALEGSAGSNEAVQFNLLSERLKAAGYEVDTYVFPLNDKPSSYFVQRYLRGEYGPPPEVSPYTASLFYGLDRFEAAPLIRQSLAEGKIVLANHYTGSNMALQGAKFSRAGEQRGFFVWDESLEFQLLGIPRPNINIYLRVPAEVAVDLIKQKGPRSYSSKSQADHETDIKGLRELSSAYDALCQLFSKDFKSIDCAHKNKPLPVTEINNSIWEIIKPLLPPPAHEGHSTVINLREKNRALNLSGKLDSSAKSKIAPSENSSEFKDISLLTVSSVIGHGLNVYYELKWPPGAKKTRLNYFIPPELPPKLADKYRSVMNELVISSGRIEKALPAESKLYAKYVAPLAVLADTTIEGSRESVQSLISGSTTPRSEKLQLTKDSRRELIEPLAVKQIIAQITDYHLGSSEDGFSLQVKLISASPKNEFDLLADYVYRRSNLSREEIVEQVDGWTYEQKAAALKAIVKSDFDSLFSRISYRFDVLDNILDLKKLADHLAPAEIQIQPPTPRYGYQVPSIVEVSGIEDLFIDCFDRSLTLYSDIQSAGLAEIAGYAVLAGHRQRWQFNVSAQKTFYSKSKLEAVKQLKEQVAEAHPIIWAALKDSSQDARNSRKIGQSKEKNTSRANRKRRRRTKSA